MPKEHENKSQTMRLWWIWGGVFCVALFFLVAIKSILLPFIVGMLVAYLLDPVADKLEEWKCSRLLATCVITVGFFAMLMTALFMLAPLLYHQIEALIADIPAYAHSLQQFYTLKLAPLREKLGAGAQLVQSGDGVAPLLQGISDVLRDIVIGIAKSSTALIGLISLCVITPVVTFYLLRDWDSITAKFESLLPLRHRDTVMEQFAIIDQTLSGFIRGQLTVCTMLGAFYAIALWLVGLKYAVMIGLIAGILIIIPYVGTIFSGLLAVGLAYMQQAGDVQFVSAVAAVFIIGQVIEGNVLTPKIVGEKVGLHPVWLIFGMMAGGALLGFVGVLMAVPLTAVIGVLLRFVLARYKDSALYQGGA